MWTSFVNNNKLCMILLKLILSHLEVFGIGDNSFRLNNKANVEKLPSRLQSIKAAQDERPPIELLNVYWTSAWLDGSDQSLYDVFLVGVQIEVIED